VGGDSEQLLFEDARRPKCGASTDDATSATPGAHAVRRGGGVTCEHPDLFDRHRKLVGQGLGDRRLVALALTDDADLGRDGAARLDPHDRGVMA
jgi:hypothetical protein